MLLLLAMLLNEWISDDEWNRKSFRSNLFEHPFEPKVIKGYEIEKKEIERERERENKKIKVELL